MKQHVVRWGKYLSLTGHLQTWIIPVRRLETARGERHTVNASEQISTSLLGCFRTFGELFGFIFLWWQVWRFLMWREWEVRRVEFWIVGNGIINVCWYWCWHCVRDFLAQPCEMLWAFIVKDGCFVWVFFYENTFWTLTLERAFIGDSYWSWTTLWSV